MENNKENLNSLRKIITIGDNSNAYIDENENCIVFKIENDLNEYDIKKYEEDEIKLERFSEIN